MKRIIAVIVGIFAGSGITALVSGAPPEIEAHYAAMPNNVRALYATFERRKWPHRTKEIKIEALGQLCFDDAAARAVAYQMYNDRLRESNWRYVSWRVEMDGPLVGNAKLSGFAPSDFSVWNQRYGPPDIKTEVRP